LPSSSYPETHLVPQTHLFPHSTQRWVANTQYTTEGTIKTPNLLEETQEDLLSAGKSLLTGNTAGMMSSLFGAAKGAFESNQAHEKTKKTKTSSADVVMWSGCKDSQTVGSSFFFPTLLSILLLRLSFVLSHHTPPSPVPSYTLLSLIDTSLSGTHPSLPSSPRKLTPERRHPRRRGSNRSNVLRLYLFTQEEP
jgi:hypothetical protein